MFVSTSQHFRCSIVVSISACHAEDPGSIPGGGAMLRGSLNVKAEEGCWRPHLTESHRKHLVSFDLRS